MGGRDDSEPKATCTDCGTIRPKEPGACPECGSRNRSIGVGAATAKGSALSAGASKSVPTGRAEGEAEALPVGIVRKIRGSAGRFVQEHPGWSAVALGAGVGGVLTGLLGTVWGIIAGLFLSVLSWYASRRIYQ